MDLLTNPDKDNIFSSVGTSTLGLHTATSMSTLPFGLTAVPEEVID